jgi:hypothetical protein
VVRQLFGVDAAVPTRLRHARLAHGRVQDFAEATRKPLTDWKTQHLADDAKQAKALADLTAKAVEANKAAEKAARERNEQIISQLNDTTREAAAMRRDRDLARLLLGVAQQTAAGRCAVPASADQSGAAEASGTSGNGSIESDLAAAFGECRRNADRLDALAAELKPQL